MWSKRTPRVAGGVSPYRTPAEREVEPDTDSTCRRYATPMRSLRATEGRCDHVSNPDDPQLTARAVISGMLLGAILCASNLYLGLKIGWLFGMSITSAILSFAIFRGASLSSRG